MTSDQPPITPSPQVPPTAVASPGEGTSRQAEVGDFAAGAEAPELGLLAEFWLFLRENKAWWMVPILLALAVLGFVAWLSGTAAAPVIYPLF